MNTLLNTSFFFSPAVEAKVLTTLRQRWIPACNAAGCAPATLLQMPAEEGVVRVAVQTPFPDESTAERFREEILEPIGAALLRELGGDNYTHFSTLMQILNY